MDGKLSIENGEVILTKEGKRTVVAYLNSGAEAEAQKICEVWNGHSDIATRAADEILRANISEQTMALKLAKIREIAG